MSLYTSSARDFILSCQDGHIARLLANAFQRYYGYRPGASEITSWRNSLAAIAEVFAQAGFDDQGILLEYDLPLSAKRVDCVITGHDNAGEQHVVLIELKQWEEVYDSAGQNEVITTIGGQYQTVLHPCAQVQGYTEYLKHGHAAFHQSNPPLHISGCSYLHNYQYREVDPLLAQKFSLLRADYPLFAAAQVPELVQFLRNKVGKTGGSQISALIGQNSYMPSKKLMLQVANSIDELPQYTLLDEQRIGFDAVLYAVDDSLKNNRKWVILVRGKPGSGKSVIALKLLGALLAQKRTANYATGSMAFTQTLKSKLTAKSGVLLKYTNSFVQPIQRKLRVLIVDEAHRIRNLTTNKQGRAIGRGTQFEQLLNATHTLVLFADDAQAIRPLEIGSVNYIRSEASRLGAHVREIELTAQFRCGGADGFVDWIDGMLGIRPTKTKAWRANANFEFKIASTPAELEKWVLDQVKTGHTGRLTAGFCWPWSLPRKNGSLVLDVVIGTFKRPWNASSKAKVLALGIPKSSLWATDPGGIGQIGCVYSAQGFEFDYVGVIFGDDLRYDGSIGKWVSDESRSYDPEIKSSKRFDEFVRNVYRILLTRGMKGCYVYFENKATEKYFREHMADTIGDAGKTP